MVNTLHFKLILFVFCSIMFALVVTGVSINYLLVSLYGENAEHESSHAYELVYENIKAIEKNMSDQSLMISIDPDVVASVNLVNRYQDIKNYQPLIFDEEKKSLASRLLERLGAFHHAKAAIYNNNGELIVFAVHHDPGNVAGITTYDKNGVLYLGKKSESDAWQAQSLPSSIASQTSLQSGWGSFVHSLGKTEYFSNENNFTVESFRTIQRGQPDGTSESIGFIKIVVAFDDHHIRKLSKLSHVDVSVILANDSFINKPDEFNDLENSVNLDYSSILFGSQQIAKKTWVEHNIYYVHSYVLPVVNGKIFILMSQPKSDLALALNKSRYTLLFIFLFTASLVIPFGIYWLNARVSRPLNTLTRQLSNIHKNTYPEFYESSSRDEISLLGNGLNKMVAVIKVREEELKSSRRDLNEAQHLAKIGSWKRDIVNNKSYWSDEIFNIFELDPKSTKPSYEALLDTVCPCDRVRVKDAYLNSLKNRQPYDIAHCLQMKDGSIKYIHEHCESIFDDEGNLLSSKGTVQDITEQKNKDQILSRAEKMNALGKLTGGIAHDFNNMLGVILGYSELLQNVLSGDAQKLKYINEVLAAGERARVLTKKLLAFSRKEATSAEVVDINKLLLEERNMLQKTLTARIDLVYDFEEDLWPVLLDKNDIQNAVLNMSINAMHAMPENGRLTIKTGNLHLDDADVRNLDIDSGDYVLVSITDTGVGMDEKTRSKLFDPFFTTKGEKGTGLGMSQVYGFVQQTGGGIYVYSEPGHGSNIVVYLPRSYENESKLSLHEDDINKQGGTGNETILVVDDEVSLRKLAEEILRAQNYRVLCAGNGIEALKILETESVDLVLSDVIMPGMDGYQLAASIQELYPNVIIQMASGFADERHQSPANENLYQQRLQKPFASKILLRKIRQLLDEKNKSEDDFGRETAFINEPSVSIQWSNKFMSGIAVMDTDHKMLVNMVKRCEKAVKDDRQDEILPILEDLIAYVGHHFEREELLMEACEYPGMDNHKRLHENLTMQVDTYVKEYANGSLTAKLLLDFLMSWLNTHIIGEDKAIAPYCKDKEIKIEQAFKKAGYDYQPNNQ